MTKKIIPPNSPLCQRGVRGDLTPLPLSRSDSVRGKRGWGDFQTNDKGFILVTVLFMLLLISVTAFTLNSRSGLQSRMALNQTQATQAYLNNRSATEWSLWRLAQNPGWRTTGQTYVYNDTSYNIIVKDASPPSWHPEYADAVTISVNAPGGAVPLINGSFRYYMDTPPPFITKKPYQLRGDAANNLYFADIDNHSVWKVDAASGVTSRLVGTGASGWSGDGGQANLAQLNGPQGVCISPSGDMYIADTWNNRIRKASAFGVISTYAGTGAYSYSGDNGPAVNATFRYPKGCAVDSAGNLYIADNNNNMIRKVTASTGVITTIAGTGLPPTNNDYNGDEQPATSAKLNDPTGVFVDALGNVFIADTVNHLIRKIDTSGTIHKVAGTAQQWGSTGDGGLATSAKLNSPTGVFLDSAGNIFIADRDNNKVRKVLAATGIISTAAGTGTAGYSGDGGLATSAQLDHPVSVYVSNTGDIMISDTQNCTLRKVAAITSTISTMATTKGVGLNAPQKVAVYYKQSNNIFYLYIADRDNHRIRVLDTSSNIVTTAAGTGTAGYSGDGGAATSAQLNTPNGISVDSSGNLFIADTSNQMIRKVAAATGIIITVAGKSGPGGYDGDEKPATSAKLNNPSGVFVDALGNFFIADTTNNRIRKVDTAGTIHTVAGTGTAGYSGDGGAATSAQLNQPKGVFLDSSGNIFIADNNNNRIRKVSAATGNISTVAGTGTAGYSGDGGPATSARLDNPNEVVADNYGNLFIADTNNHAIRFVSIYDGKIKTLAGVYPESSGFNGDNKIAVTAKLNTPGGIVLSGSQGGGKIYIGDTNNNRIRTLTLKKVKELY